MLENYEELLFEDYKNGIITWNELSARREEMLNRQEIIEAHKQKHNITQCAQGWITRVDDPNAPKGLRKVKKARLEDLEEYIIQYYKDCVYNPTVQDIFEEWIKAKEETRCPSYIMRLRTAQKSWFGEFEKLLIKEVTEDDVYNFISGQISSGRVSENGLKKIEGNLNGIFKKAKRMRLCEIDLKTVYENIREDNKKENFKPTYRDGEVSRDKAFTYNECERLREYCKTSTKLVDKGLALMTYLPDRVGEISAIRKEDVSKDFSFIDIHATEIRYKDKEGKDQYTVKERTKTAASMRVVPIPAEARPILKEIMLMSRPDSEWLFCDQKYDRYPIAKFYRRMSTVCKNLGITTSKGLAKSPHRLRHTYANRLSTVKDVSDKTKAALMGHKEYDMTRYYQCDMTDNEEKLEIVDAMFG